MAMSTGCSQSSSSSTTNPPYEVTFHSLLKCWCGIPTPILTSNTSKNNGRKFFGCCNFKGSMRSCVFFRWLDEACIVVDTASNEVDNLPVLIQMEEDIANLKADSAKLKNDIEDIKKRMNFHVQNSGHEKNYGP
ncbi:hypothetical protein M9H77_07352 [Catharanthus roseus]|uniref:Uncharacterized protein n=1 Tax=Catharanthus roseus TaxID=4058 RepID=A0ACC0BUP2_CATRO|nr:hypothetical protein M9H77_07352 [Catharanthus roseus]